MNNLNLLISDFTNDVDQNTQCVWWLNDSDLPQEEVTDDEGKVVDYVDHKPENNEWLLTNTTPDGKSPILKPLTVDFDYQGML